MGNCLSVTCFKCYPTLNISNEIGLDVIIDDNCCRIGKVQNLRDKMDDLRALKSDVDSEINANHSTQVEVSHEVQTWRKKVGELDDEVSRIIYSDAANGMACCFLCSKKKFGILSRINRIHDLRHQRNSWRDSSVFIRRHPPDIPECLPANVVVGMKDVMLQVIRYLGDSKVGVIGIHGMGGAGKTTLAKQLMKILSPSLSPSTSAATRGQESVKFDKRIWVTVSQNLDIGKLQKDIAVQLGIYKRSEFEDEGDESIRARFISSYLSARRFLLVLDDVWEQFDLTSIGIPQLPYHFGSKIVLTTREAKVSIDMGARKSTVKVGYLGEEESWELFKNKIQWTDDEFKEKDIYQIARGIVRKCHGLPLVLITMARAMATKEDKASWKHVAEEMKDSPHIISQMEHVYELLEVSYNRLKRKEHKSCLLYSALFPEDAEIEIATMVDYCIGGGSVSIASSSSNIGAAGDLVKLRGEGRIIISELIDACLLERGKDEDHVKVHDAIRDMILKWIGRHNSERSIVSHAGKRLRERHYANVAEWRAASMFSLSYNYIYGLVMEEKDHQGKSTAQCSGNVDEIPFQANNLQVLLLNNGLFRGHKLPVELLFCPNLRVLDLSHTSLEEIPLALCSLKLLQYLNLSYTKLKTLPKEMQNLKNLMQLDLCWTRKLRESPNDLFSPLSMLQSLQLYGSFPVCLRVLKEIGGHVPLLKELSLPILGEVDAVEFLVDGSNSLSNAVTKLDITGVDICIHFLFKRMGSKFKKLELLRISSPKNGDKEDLVIDDGHFSELKELYISKTRSFRQIILNGRALEHLTCLYISECFRLRDLACLWKLRNLKKLRIRSCEQIVELMEGHAIIDHHQVFLPKVECIKLECCNSMRLSRRSSLQLPSLRKLMISDCPSIEDISMIDSLHKVEIQCPGEWWEDLIWNNTGGAPPPNFLPNFIEIDDFLN